MESNKVHQERLREIAALIDCIPERDLCILAGVKEGTAEAWRKRGKAPPYVVLGTTILYPVKGLAEHVVSLMRQPRSAPPAGSLL